MIILLVIVAFDLSFLVRYITRFTEESFAVLISVIFIYEACSKTVEVYDQLLVVLSPCTHKPKTLEPKTNHSLKIQETRSRAVA